MSKLKVTTISDPDNDNTALTIDSSGNVTASQNTTLSGDVTVSGGFIPSTQLSHRNLIMNGAMQVAQRGTSETGVTSTSYVCDRYRWYSNLADTVTISQSTDAPDNFAYSLKMQVTTADTSTTNCYACFEQMIEAQDLQHLQYNSSNAKTLTASFWVKSSQAGTHIVGMYADNGSTNRDISTTYTVNSANTWEYKTVSFIGNTSEPINNDNGRGLRLWFIVDARGDKASGSNDTWGGVGNRGAGIGNELLDTVGNTFQITGVQLEVGSVATPFEHRSYGEELARCQRYYWRSFYFGSAYYGMRYGSTNVMVVIELPTTMRVTPTVSYTGFTGSGTLYSTYNNADRLQIYISDADGAAGVYGTEADAEL